LFISPVSRPALQEKEIVMTLSNRSKLIAIAAIAAWTVTVPALEAAHRAPAKTERSTHVRSLSAGDLVLGWWNTLVSLVAPAGARIDGNGSPESAGARIDGNGSDAPLNDAGARIDGNGSR
jgi:hypothetical protein